MSDPIDAPTWVERNGHRTWLKWHRARRHRTDPAFTAARILEAIRLGASAEVDLLVHADRGYAVLHDLTLDAATTGTGRVADMDAATLRTLHLRGNDGAPLPDRVLLLEDLCALLQEHLPHPDALLQLDFKEDAAVLDPAALAAFQDSVGPVASNMILSAGDARAVDILTRDVPGLRIGYDPCHDGALERLAQTRDYAGFVAAAVAASPRAEMIYLAYPMVLAVAADGFDMIAAFHAAGLRIDAYTIKTADAASLAQVEQLLALQVDQITTDDPEALWAHLR